MDSCSSCRSVPSLDYGRRSPTAPLMNTRTPARESSEEVVPARRRSAFMALSSAGHEDRCMTRRCSLRSPGTEVEVGLMLVGELACAPAEGATEAWRLTVRSTSGSGGSIRQRPDGSSNGPRFKPGPSVRPAYTEDAACGTRLGCGSIG